MPAPAPAAPSLSECTGWIGLRIDDQDGARLGRVEELFTEACTGEPRWLLVRLGLFGERRVLVPAALAMPGSGRVWLPAAREDVRESVEAEPGVTLNAAEERAASLYWRMPESAPAVPLAA